MSRYEEKPRSPADSLGKDFGAGGLRLGCLVTRNDELLRAFSAIS